MTNDEPPRGSPDFDCCRSRHRSALIIAVKPHNKVNPP